MVVYEAHTEPQVPSSLPSNSKQLEGQMGFCAPEGTVTVTPRTDVRFLPRLCILRCSLQYKKFPISLSHWPVLLGLKPPSWDTRYGRSQSWEESEEMG